MKKVRKSKYDGILKVADNDKLLWILESVADKKLTPQEAAVVIGQGATLIPLSGGQQHGVNQPQQQPQTPQGQQGQQ